MKNKFNWLNILACSLFLLTQEQAHGKTFDNDEAKKRKQNSTHTQDNPLDSLPPTDQSTLATNRIEYRIFEQGKHLKGIPPHYQKIISAYVKHFTVRDRRLIREMLQRQPEYFPMYEACLRKHELPDELKYLSILESNLNPRAVSQCRAMGLWQFTSSTGRYYDLHQDVFRDERMDPDKATEAACKYLKDLHGMFGNWPLALAAYNCGPGMVRRAIRHSGNRKSYWQICARLPQETRNYVPKFIALYQVMTEFPRYNFTVDSLNTPLSLDTIIVHRHLDMHLLASQLDLPRQALHQLNPSLKGNTIPGDAKGYSIRIPADRKDFFALNRQAVLDSSAIALRKDFYSKQTLARTQMERRVKHLVKSGESLRQLASRYKVTVVEIRKWNHLKSQTIKKGQRLVIWQKNTKALKFALATKDI
ncbi:MAG: transglycosylase SLT domain-containing protein [Bacteroidota bacterium]